MGDSCFKAITVKVNGYKKTWGILDNVFQRNNSVLEF